MQQYLPFTVLKRFKFFASFCDSSVATVLTVYGIETDYMGHGTANADELQQYLPFTVLKLVKPPTAGDNDIPLQQYLPFTVLKHYWTLLLIAVLLLMLQQYLPLAVLKPIACSLALSSIRCNSTYRLRY